jgi:outer membrane protein TolC
MEGRRESCVRIRVGALLALAALAGGCVLAPRATREERLRAVAAGRAWAAPAAARALRALSAAPDWRALLAHAFLASGELEAAYHEWRAALDRIDVAAGYPNTNVALGFEYLFSDDNLKAWDRTTLGVGFDPMQNLSFPTKVLAAGRVAFEDARAAGRRFEATKFDLQRRVLTAWHEYALLAEKIRVQRATVALLRLQEGGAAGRVAVGAPQQEVLRAEVERGLAEDVLRRLEAEIPQERARLNALVGRDAGATLEPPAALPSARALPADDARLLAVATDRNPELAALAHVVTGREHAVELARQQLIPDFNPFAGFEGSMAQVAGVMISLPARLPAIRGAIREARAMLRGAEAIARQRTLDRGADFVAALVMLRDLERQTALVETQLLGTAERAAASARASYETGTLGLGELVETERLVLELRLLAAEARTGREVRLAELEALAGVDVETLAGGGTPS